MRQRFFVAFMIVILGFAPTAVRAESAQLTATPVVIDEKAKARDIIKESVTITNTADHKLDIYPAVNNVEARDGEQQFTPAQGSEDLAASLANWIELSRGVIELSPGETKEVPFVIHVNLNAVPGTYHAQISFFAGTTRDEAQAAGALATVSVNLDVEADVKEIMQLNKFTTGKFYLSGDDVRFDYLLENIGNQDLAPRGEIRVYDRTGAEVASVDVNKEGKAVSPEQISQLASVWNAAQGFGQYKALLTVYYGRGQTASVQDTVFFWIVPWKQLIGLFVAGLAAVIFFAFWVHRSLEARVAARQGAAPAAVPAASSRSSRIADIARVPVAFAARLAAGVRSLRRGERRLPARSAAPAARETAPAVAEPVVAARPITYAPPPVAAPVHADPAPTATIDLKNLRQAAPDTQVSGGHVIDLKRLR